MALNPSSLERIAKWNAKMFPEGMQSDYTSPVLKAQRELVQTLISRHFEAIADFEARTKAVLDEEGISRTQYPFYIYFSRQIYHLICSGCQGASLRNAVNIYLQRWVADGFTQAILERIRDIVWGIAAPGP